MSASAFLPDAHAERFEPISYRRDHRRGRHTGVSDNKAVLSCEGRRAIDHWRWQRSRIYPQFCDWR